MATVSSTHYGIDIRFTLDNFPACCGGSSIYSWRVEERRAGALDALSEHQKHQMYLELAHALLSRTPGSIVAMEPVLSFGDWGDLKKSTSGYKQSGSAGDVSLEDFCNFIGFDKGAISRNRNSGNLIQVYSLATFVVDPSNPNKVTNFADSIDKADFSDDVKPERKTDADLDSIIDAINEALG